MPPQLLFPIDHLDPARLQMTIEQVRTYNPQRFEMEQIDGIIAMDVGARTIVGLKNVRPDEFWVRGHIPGRPLLPGVIMVEAAAQVCTILVKEILKLGSDRFLGFAGIDNARFRGAVSPGDRLIILGKNLEARARHSVSRAQGVVEGRVVFECDVMGMFM